MYIFVVNKVEVKLIGTIRTDRHFSQERALILHQFYYTQVLCKFKAMSA